MLSPDTNKVTAADLSLSYAERWNGEHRGVRFEVTRRPSYPSSWHDRTHAWCHYLYVNEQQFDADTLAAWTPKRDDHKDYVGWDYYGSPWAGLEWHGEITYLEIKDDGRGHRVFKPGCDYQHGFDDGHRYTLDFVVREVKATIDSLWERVPNLKVRCGWDGSYHALADMEAWGDGWISKQGKEKRDEAKPPASAGRGA